MSVCLTSLTAEEFKSSGMLLHIDWLQFTDVFKENVVFFVFKKSSDTIRGLLFFETSVTFWHSTWCNIHVDLNLYKCLFEKLRSRKFNPVYMYSMADRSDSSTSSK